MKFASFLQGNTERKEFYMNKGTTDKLKVIGAVIFIAILLLAFKSSDGAEPPDSATHVVVHVAKDKDSGPENIQKTMSMDNPRASLSGICSTIGDVGYISIFGTISSTETKSFWMDTQILKHRLGITKLRLYINSPGGSGQDGVGLADLIKSAQEDGFEVEVYATGIVASAAVPVLAACSRRVANPGCMFMVHNAKLFKYVSQESAADLAAQARMMEILTKRYLDIMEENTTRTAEEWKKAMDKTTWFTAEEALEWGLIDEIH